MKKKAKGPRQIQVKLMLPEPVHKRLKIAAIKQGRTIVEIAAELVAKHLPR